MKVACLLFLILALTMPSAAFMQDADAHPHDAGHAAPGDDGKRQKEVTTGERRNARGTSDKTRSHSRASMTATKRPAQFSKKNKHAASGNGLNPRQPNPDKSGGAAKGGLIQHEAVNRAPQVRSANVFKPNAASLLPSANSPRHRGPNPAVVGGSAHTSSSNTGAINGTSMHRKP
jgi:hypothetical protein